MHFHKIKYNGQQVEIAYSDDPEAKTQRTLTSQIPPLPEFIKALSEFAIEAANWIEAGAEYASTLDVRGVLLTTKKGVMGAQIICVKKLNNCPSPFCFNTPHRMAGPVSIALADLTPEEREKYLPESCVKKIEALKREAEKYIKGETAQLKLAA